MCPICNQRRVDFIFISPFRPVVMMGCHHNRTDEKGELIPHSWEVPQPAAMFEATQAKYKTITGFDPLPVEEFEKLLASYRKEKSA